MQHLDEGTIHAWLDGALSPEEAVRAEAHVTECPPCAAAVAEARGFIAASSRILTALDNAPRGVIPASAPKKRLDPTVWRIAATVMVVAAGTLVVVRSQKNDVRSEATVADSVMALSAPTSATAAPMTVTPAPSAAPGSVSGVVVPAPPVATAQTMRREADIPAATNNAKRAEVKSRADASVAEGGFTAPGQNSLSAKVSAPEIAAATPAPPSVLAAPRTADAAAMDQAAIPDSLKVIGRPRRLGARVTVYEIAPGDTVTFTESTTLALSSVVVTGAGTTRMAPQAAGKAAAAAPRREEVRPTNAADSQPAPATRSGAVAGSPSPAQRVGALGGLNSISWVDPVTGATLTLSGRVSEARLQQTRFRIERERAAAAAKKSP
jgi:Putative zinc-finger